MAKFVSAIFNPEIVLFFGLFFSLYDLVIKYDPIGYVSFIILIGTIPLYFYILELFRRVNSRNSEITYLDRNARNSVYLSAVFSSLAAVVVITQFELNPFWAYSAMLATVFFGVLYFINKFIEKISFHTAAFGFTVVFAANAVSLYWLIALIFLPLIAVSRLTLKKHTKLQLLMGAAVGMFIALISWTFV